MASHGPGEWQAWLRLASAAARGSVDAAEELAEATDGPVPRVFARVLFPGSIIAPSDHYAAPGAEGGKKAGHQDAPPPRLSSRDTLALDVIPPSGLIGLATVVRAFRDNRLAPEEALTAAADCLRVDRTWLYNAVLVAAGADADTTSRDKALRDVRARRAEGAAWRRSYRLLASLSSQGLLGALPGHDDDERDDADAQDGRSPSVPAVSRLDAGGVAPEKPYESAGGSGLASRLPLVVFALPHGSECVQHDGDGPASYERTNPAVAPGTWRGALALAARLSPYARPWLDAALAGGRMHDPLGELEEAFCEEWEEQVEEALRGQDAPPPGPAAAVLHGPHGAAGDGAPETAGAAPVGSGPSLAGSEPGAAFAVLSSHPAFASSRRSLLTGPPRVGDAPAAAAVRLYLWSHMGLRAAFAGTGSLAPAVRPGSEAARLLLDCGALQTAEDGAEMVSSSWLALAVHLVEPAEYAGQQAALARRERRRAAGVGVSRLDDAGAAGQAAAGRRAREAEGPPTPGLTPLRGAWGGRFTPVLAPAVTVDILPALRPMVARAIRAGDDGSGRGVQREVMGGIGAAAWGVIAASALAGAAGAASLVWALAPGAVEAAATAVAPSFGVRVA